MRLLALLLIGWLAMAQVSALWDKDNFNKLDAYLNKMVPNNDNLHDNFVDIKLNLDKMTDGVKMAARMLLELNENVANCNNNLVSIMLELRKTNLLLTGQKRIERLLESGWRNARQVCSQDISQSFNQSRPAITKFFVSFLPYVDIIKYHRSYSSLANQHVYINLRQLAQEFPEMRFETRKYNDQKRRSVRVKDRAKFDKAFDELFVKPCQSIVSDDQLMESMRALTMAEISHAKTTNNNKYTFHIDSLLYDMNWTREVCNRIIHMDTHEKNRVYKS